MGIGSCSAGRYAAAAEADSVASSSSSSSSVTPTGEVTNELPVGGDGRAARGSGGSTNANGGTGGAGGAKKGVAAGEAGLNGAGSGTGAGGTGSGGGEAPAGAVPAGAGAGAGGAALDADCLAAAATPSGVVPHGRRTLPACTVTGSEADRPAGGDRDDRGARVIGTEQAGFWVGDRLFMFQQHRVGLPGGEVRLHEVADRRI